MVVFTHISHLWAHFDNIPTIVARKFKFNLIPTTAINRNLPPHIIGTTGGLLTCITAVGIVNWCVLLPHPTMKK